MVSPSDRIVIIGAGVFGLSLAYQLASEGNQNVTVMDRHVPPVSTKDETFSHQALVRQS
jgi:glycine/D-amino acid oxidase-like deaminating enzyme